VEEQQRLAQLSAQQVAAGLAPIQTDVSKPQSIMPPKTREALKMLVSALRKANGEATAPENAPHVPSPEDPKQAPQPVNRPDRRATLFDTSHDDLSMPASAPPSPGRQASPTALP
jgi:penicillin-binding protein 1A